MPYTHLGPIFTDNGKLLINIMSEKNGKKIKINCFLKHLISKMSAFGKGKDFKN